MPSVGTITFLIEETSLGSLTFKGATGLDQFDDLEYEFSFEIILPEDDTDDPTELAARSVNLRPDQQYTFVMSGSLENPQLFLWEQPGRDWIQELDDAADDDEEITVMEVSFGHVSTELGDVDIYLEEPGTSPVSTVPKASLAYSEFNEAIELTAGDFQLIVTPPGDPETILFASNPFTLFSATSTLVTLMDDGGFSTAELAISLIGAGSGTVLTDINATGVVSALHAALGTGPLDIYDSSDFGEPLIEGLSFGTISGEVQTDADGEILSVSVTPQGNLGVFLTQADFNVFDGAFYRLVFSGLPGDLNTSIQRYDRASQGTHARVQLYNAAVRFSFVDIYVVEPDKDIQLIGPTFSQVLYGTGTSYVSFEEDTYNIFVTERGTNNVIAGPLQRNLEAGENYSIVVVDSANLSAVDMLFFDESEY